jgi:glycerophosphoryl diester phosphodiesterase
LCDRNELWCTAVRIDRPRHDYIENTLPSMRAAFDHGADVVEIDEHPTTDGQFAVFHDWTLDCRTNGHGVTREQTMPYLKSLDVGYGYTADGGVTFPLRGKGVGLMPSLAEVLDAFPGRRFLVNIKSNEESEAEKLARFLRNRPREELRTLAFYGAECPITRLLELVPELRGFTRSSVKSCLARYLAYGWTGVMPSVCRHTLQVLPSNYAGYLWGWPHRFFARMAEADSEVFIVGARSPGDDNGLSGIDSPAELAALGESFEGGIWTNRIDLLGPGARQGAIQP